jgi:hypothetical protein
MTLKEWWNGLIHGWGNSPSTNSQFGPLGKLFNDYWLAYMGLSQPTEETLEILIPAHKIVLFGSQAKKQKYFNEQAKKFGWSPDTPSWYNLSSEIPEIVGDLRIRDGKLFINHLNVGHELCHTIARMDERVMDSDEIATLK